jgi:hypothetical protein
MVPSLQHMPPFHTHVFELPKEQTRHVNMCTSCDMCTHFRTCQDVRMQNLSYAAHVVFEVLEKGGKQ